MKIVLVTHHFAPCTGGVERVVHDTAVHLKEAGHQAKVVCLNRCANAKEKLKDRETVDGIPVERLPFFDFNYYKVAPAVLEHVKDADVIHVHGIGFFSDWLLWKKEAHGKPVVVSTHGGIFHTPALGWLKEWYFNVVQKRLLAKADAVLAVSDQDRERFKKICKKVRLFENAVNLNRFRFVGPGPATHWLFLGRLSRNKGLHQLIETFSFVVREKPATRLLIAGQDVDWLRRDLELLATHLGMEHNVEFLDAVPDTHIGDVLTRARFFVSASTYEGFGLAALEAMASGLVVALSDIPAHRSLVQHGKNGFLVDFSRPEVAGKQLLELAAKSEEELHAMGRTAREHAAKYSWGERIKALEGIYRKLV